MRFITSHAINPANEAIQVIAIDGPGPGGASHRYGVLVGNPHGDKRIGQIAYEGYCDQTGGKSLVSGLPLPEWDAQKPEIQAAWENAAARTLRFAEAQVILAFQNGPVKENGEGVNGITHESLLAVLIDRLEGFQAGAYANPYNALALNHLREALSQLQARTRERMARGVEGTHQQ